MVQLHDEGNPVGVLPAHASQHPEGGRDGVAATLDGEFDDLLTVEVDRVLREARTRGMFDALIDRKDRHVSGPAEPAVVVDRLDVLEAIWGKSNPLLYGRGGLWGRSGS